ncbi:MAG: hypothetical protein Q9218_005704 [Villophora microphyllina]
MSGRYGSPGCYGSPGGYGSPAACASPRGYGSPAGYGSFPDYGSPRGSGLHRSFASGQQRPIEEYDYIYGSPRRDNDMIGIYGSPRTADPRYAAARPVYGSPRRDYNMPRRNQTDPDEYDDLVAVAQRVAQRQKNDWIAGEQRRALEAQRRREAQRRNDPPARNGAHLVRARSHRVAGYDGGLALHHPYDCECADCYHDIDFYTADEAANQPRRVLVGPTAREILPYRRDKAPEHRQTRVEDGGKVVFHLVKRIGEGGQGYCDLYKSQSDGKLFVCKVMKNDFGVIMDKGKPKEVRILNEILENHRRIIHLAGWSCETSTTTIWYTYCSGGDLQHLSDAYIKHQSHIPESFIWHAFRQLAEAFAYIHFGYDKRSPDTAPPKSFKPIIHRDVKPANVFLEPGNLKDSYPNLVLADFGIATTEKSTEGKYIGTMSYQGPEIPAHSRAGDIWSLGACIHVMCTGSPPMSRAPKGVSASKWSTDPKARVVADVTRYGYSKQLRKALYLVCRVHRKDRVIGKWLMKQVDKLRDESGVKWEPLASWAVKRFTGVGKFSK